MNVMGSIESEDGCVAETIKLEVMESVRFIQSFPFVLSRNLEFCTTHELWTHASLFRDKKMPPPSGAQAWW